MRDVRVSHDQVVVADPRAPATFDRSAIDGDELTNFVVVTDLQPRRLARISNVLRREANRTERGEAIVRANLRSAIDDNMRRETTVRAQFDTGPNDTIGPNLARRMYFAFRINDCRRMNRFRQIALPVSF
jgi:hypothetical protein